MNNLLNSESKETNIVSEDNESVLGYRWQEKQYDLNSSNSLVNQFSLDKLLAKILSIRGIKNTNLKNYLSPKIKNILPDPSTISDLDNATKLIFEVIEKKKKIGIFGDYDVDGATATSLLCSYFKNINIEFEYYIPDRIKEGYGPNIKAFEKLVKKGCELIITVDCGTTSNTVIESAIKKKIKVIVVDHHQQGKDLPAHCLIINPNKKIDQSNLKNLAAVGVTFLLLVSINRKLKENSFFLKKNEPNLIQYLDLVALGTICDSVHLDLLNRTLVKQGIKIINQTKNLGLRSLINASGIEKDRQIDEYHLGYVLGPRINAGGRIGKASSGVELLITKDKNYSSIIANELNELNIERQKIEKQVEDMAHEKIFEKEHIICVHGKDWHQGVIGIVAGRLTEKFSKPSIVISENDSLCKGSARSINGFDIGALITQASQQNILESGGGHQMAAGLSINRTNIISFKKFLKNNYSNINISKKKFFDSKIKLSLIDKKLYNMIKSLAPFGSGNPKPKFLIEGCFIKFPKLVGNNHIACFLSDIYGNSIKAIAFKAYDSKVGESLMNSNGKILNLIGQIDVNFWNKIENLQIKVEDVILC